MKTKVNFSFISMLEGGAALNGYVPDIQYSKSGVTIATGFDLGCRTVADLAQLPEALATKLSPYCGLIRSQAAKALSEKPLVINEDEAEIIDLHSKADMLDLLKARYNRASQEKFEDLPEQAQTVIASIAFQYGNAAKRCPKFWQCAVNQNWAQMLVELRNFGDRYPTRRNREADYLSTMEYFA